MLGLISSPPKSWCSGGSCLTESPGLRFGAVSLHLRGGRLASVYTFHRPHLYGIMGVGASGTGSAQIELSAATVKVSITQIELSHPSSSIGVFGSLHQRVYIPAEKHDWLPLLL